MDAPIVEILENLKTIFKQITQFLKSNCPDETLEKVSDCLKIATESLKCQEIRTFLEDENLATLADVITKYSSEIDDANIEEKRCHCLAECYRSLRNACAGCPRNQDKLFCYQQCLEFTKIIIQKKIMTQKSEHLNDSCIILLRCAIQFLGNLVVGHSDNQTVVWNIFLSCFRDLVDYGDPKLTNYTCMLIHSCLSGFKDQTVSSVVNVSQFYPVTLSVIKCITEEDFEFGLYMIQDVMSIGGFLANIFKDLNSNEKLLVLEVMINQLKNSSDDKHFDDQVPAVDNLLYLVQEVKSNAYRVLTLSCSGTEQNLNPAVIVKQIEMLCLATSFHKMYPQLQEDGDLITCCVYLLQSIHEIGKEGNNQFTGVTKASESHKVDGDHPSFGLKRDLIRIIGNLSYNNRKNQDKVRELNGIPLVLDLTNIDRKNPYITQWSVLAIHNLCENNPENKAILAGLKLQGLDNNVNILKDFGIDAEIKGDKIHVKPTSDK